MRHRSSGVSHQIMQQLKFLWCQTQEPAILAHRPASRIQFDVADDDGRTHVAELASVTGFRIVTADGRPQPGGQLRNGKGFCNVVVRSRVESFDLIPFPIPHGEHQDGKQGGFLSYSPARLDSTHTGHVDVEKNSVNPAGSHFQKSLFTVGRRHYSEAQGAECCTQDPAEVRVVVGNKNIAAKCRHIHERGPAPPGGKSKPSCRTPPLLQPTRAPDVILRSSLRSKALNPSLRAY